MGDKYTVDFTINQVKFYELNKFFDLVQKQIDPTMRNNMQIIITDNIGGKHYILQQYGSAPNGDKCKDCNLIDCSECATWSRKEKMKEDTEKNGTEVDTIVKSVYNNNI